MVYMNPHISKSEKHNGKLHIVLSGQLGLKYHQELLSIVCSIDQEADDVELHLDLPSGIDLSFLQMLMALKSEQSARGKLLTISASLQQADEQLMARTGFGALFNETIF